MSPTLSSRCRRTPVGAPEHAMAGRQESSRLDAKGQNGRLLCDPGAEGHPLEHLGMPWVESGLGMSRDLKRCHRIRNEGLGLSSKGLAAASRQPAGQLPWPDGQGA